jgi:hypothetical protein
MGARTSSPRKPRYQLHMRRVSELVDRGHNLESVAAVDQEAGIAGEGGGVAGYADHDRNLA